MADFAPPEYNPRWVLWLRSIGETPETFRRQEPEPYGELTKVDVDGQKTLWTIAYVEWVCARWREWAAELGFTTGDASHRLPWERALAAGHTQEDFDRWLERKAAP